MVGTAEAYMVYYVHCSGMRHAKLLRCSSDMIVFTIISNQVIQYFNYTGRCTLVFSLLELCEICFCGFRGVCLGLWFDFSISSSVSLFGSPAGHLQNF